MPSVLSTANSTTPFTLPHAERLASRFRVPLEDVLLIALNLYGASSKHGGHRARLSVRLASRPEDLWMVIIPLNADSSPFRADVGGDLLLGSEPVGTVERTAADETVGGYFRDGGRAATLNPNARSRCVGCAFCPNTLEAAADPRLLQRQRLSVLLSALRDQHPGRDLGALREVTVSTGCFEREGAAVEHLRHLRHALGEHGARPRIGFLSSVVTSASAFRELAECVSPFVLRLTAECFTRRDLLLKASKAVLTAEEMPEVLTRAREAGHGASFTYIAGLDPVPSLREGMRRLAPMVTDFPNFQVYQAHNVIMSGLRAQGAAKVEYYLHARREIEEVFAPTELRPSAWECYRPLWYYTFADEPLVSS